MPYLFDWYIAKHADQFDGTATQGAGCVWTTLANGARTVTVGHVDRTPSQIHALVPRSQETSPATPGWSIPDAVLAMSRLDRAYAYELRLDDRSGDGFAGILHALDDGLYVVAQGDSDRFGNATCSGHFDGDHCIGIHPVSRMMAWGRERWIDDPICPTGRWEREAVLRAYVEKLNPRAQFAVFMRGVPRRLPQAPDTSTGPQLVMSWPAPVERNVMIASMYTGHIMRLVKGQPLFRYPGGPVAAHMSAAGAVEHAGSGGKGWSVVRVPTMAVYADGKTRPTGLYVPNAAGPII